MSKGTRVWIGTLYSGEREFPECVCSLEAQSFRNFEHQVFRFLPNLEAHRRLYRTIMDRADEFDVFVKLDADMVFKDAGALAQIASIFRDNVGLDHCVFSVADWYSGTDILGLHSYSGRAHWGDLDDPLFVDPDPAIPGRKMELWDCPAPIAEHSPNPSLRQAFFFGLHRGLKVVQRGTQRKNRFQCRFQFELLKRVWALFREGRDQRRGAALFGAEEALTSDETVMVSKEPHYPVLETLTLFSAERMYERLRGRWQPGPQLLYRQLRLVHWVELLARLRSLSRRIGLRSRS